MLTPKDFTIARAIVEQLNIPCKFGTNIDEEYFYAEDLMEQVSALHVGDFFIENGVSKAVIIFDSFDFVIKIPFNGSWYGEPIYDDNDEWVEIEYYFEEFHGARAPNQSDYCWDECIEIEKARDMGFGALFPDTSILCEINSRRFYIQEKVNTARQFHPTPSEKSYTRAKNLDNYYRLCGEDWNAMVIEFYGEGFLKSFIDWCMSDYEIHILSDMHSGNYGYRIDGAPVILDCSGFNE